MSGEPAPSLSPRPEAKPAITGRSLLVWAGASLALALLTLLACSLVGQPELQLSLGVWQLRLGRLAAAAVVGAALATGGMALQGLLRNPLAEPYILGISSGAGVGVLLGMAVMSWSRVAGGQLQVGGAAWLARPALAFAGALITGGIVYGVAQRRGRLDPYSLILAGVIVNIFNGAVMLTIYLFVKEFVIADFASWSMGRIPEGADLTLLGFCGLLVLVGWALLLARGASFNALTLGDDVAATSGVHVHALRLETFAVAGLMTAAAVALAGPVGFVGLIIPHVCRMLVGPDHRLLIIVSGFVGAIFLMVAETACQALGPRLNVGYIPVGIVTAFCGGPFFIYLLRRRFRERPL